MNARIDLESEIHNIKDLSLVLHLWLSETTKDTCWENLGPSIALARVIREKAIEAVEAFEKSLKEKSLKAVAS